MLFHPCTCSDVQLDLVGCDCSAEEHFDSAPKATINIFVDGYASDNKAAIKVLATASDDECCEYARKLYPYGRVYHIGRPTMGPIQKFSPEYVREMSMGG